jgi:hypothetical protein
MTCSILGNGGLPVSLSVQEQARQYLYQVLERELQSWRWAELPLLIGAVPSIFSLLISLGCCNRV